MSTREAVLLEFQLGAAVIFAAFGGQMSIRVELQARVLFRDKWICYVCRGPIVFVPALKYLQAFVEQTYPYPLAYWHLNWRRDLAPMVDFLGENVDHVVPKSKGGKDEEKNLQAICVKCNMQKGNLPLDEFLKRYPRPIPTGKYGSPEIWDGFASVFMVLTRDKKLTGSEAKWRIALEKEAAAADAVRKSKSAAAGTAL